VHSSEIRWLLDHPLSRIGAKIGVAFFDRFVALALRGGGVEW
jgi:hypothetical protein